MCLQVRLVNDVQAVLIAQVQEASVVGVMTCADRIDVELLAHAHIRHHVLQRQRATGAGAELVTVDAAENQALAVEHENGVDDLEAAEAHALRHCLVVVSIGAVKREVERIQGWIFRRPWVYAVEFTMQ